MARYIGAAVAVAAAATIDNAVLDNHLDQGATRANALAAGLAAASVMMAIWTAAGVGLIALMGRYRAGRTSTVERAAAAAATTHTIPTRPSVAS